MLACAAAAATPGRDGRAPPRDRELPRARAVAPHDELLLGPVPDALRRGRPQARDVHDVRRGGQARRRRRSIARSPSRSQTQKRALLFLNDPCHNPTGYSMTAEEWRAVVERLVAHSRRGADHAARRHRVLRLRRAARSARVPEGAAPPARQGRASPSRGARRRRSPTTGCASARIVACVPDAKERASDRGGVQLLVPRHLVELHARRHARDHAPAHRARDGASRATPSARS